MDPITRKETFLAKAGGQDVTTPTPVTREEYFLNQIANGGGSGGGVLVVHDVDGTLDKTWQEIQDAAPLVWLLQDTHYSPIGDIGSEGGHFWASFCDLIQSGISFVDYGATSADGHPVQQ